MEAAIDVLPKVGCQSSEMATMFEEIVSGEENMNVQLDKALRFHQTALDLRAKRQEILSANIANADTPNYKARDIDFGSSLNNALGGGMGMQPVALVRTSPQHFAASGNEDDSQLLYRTEEQSSVDGNTVNMDTERAAFAENALQYEASLTFINGLFSTMQKAIANQ